MKTFGRAVLFLIVGAVMPAASAERTLRVAVVQMSSVDHDIDANLRHATALAEEAARQGAQFVLLPEFMATGSYLAFDT